jgi:hypothetical protein
MGEIKLRICEMLDDIFYVEVINKNKIVFSADGTADALFWLFAEHLESKKIEEINLDNETATFAFYLLSSGLMDKFSRPIRRIIKKNRFQKLFKTLPVTKVIKE